VWHHMAREHMHPPSSGHHAPGSDHIRWIYGVESYGMHHAHAPCTCTMHMQYAQNSEQKTIVLRVPSSMLPCSELQASCRASCWSAELRAGDLSRAAHLLLRVGTVRAEHRGRTARASRSDRKSTEVGPSCWRRRSPSRPRCRNQGCPLARRQVARLCRRDLLVASLIRRGANGALGTQGGRLGTQGDRLGTQRASWQQRLRAKEMRRSK